MDLYKYSHLSYVGGGFNKIGIHNIMEPCVYGNKIIIGPNYRNYPEAIDLMKLDVCSVIENEHELTEQINTLFENQSQLFAINKKSNTYFYSKIGASAKGIAEIKAVLFNKNIFK